MLEDKQQICQRFHDINTNTLGCVHHLYYNEIYDFYIPRSTLVEKDDTQPLILNMSYTTYSMCAERGEFVQHAISGTAVSDTQKLCLRAGDYVPLNAYEAIKYVVDGNDGHIQQILSNRASIYTSVLDTQATIQQHYKALQSADISLAQREGVRMFTIKASDIERIRLFLASDCEYYCARVELFSLAYVPHVSPCMQYDIDAYMRVGRVEALGDNVSEVQTHREITGTQTNYNTQGALIAFMSAIGISAVSIVCALIGVSKHRYARAIRHCIYNVRRSLRSYLPQARQQEVVIYEHRPRISANFNRRYQNRQRTEQMAQASIQG